MSITTQSTNPSSVTVQLLLQRKQAASAGNPLMGGHVSTPIQLVNSCVCVCKCVRNSSCVFKHVRDKFCVCRCVRAGTEAAVTVRNCVHLSVNDFLYTDSGVNIL